MDPYIKMIDEFEQRFKNAYGEAQLSHAELLSAEQMIEIALAKIAEKERLEVKARKGCKGTLNGFCEKN